MNSFFFLNNHKSVLVYVKEFKRVLAEISTHFGKLCKELLGIALRPALKSWIFEALFYFYFFPKTLLRSVHISLEKKGKIPKMLIVFPPKKTPITNGQIIIILLNPKVMNVQQSRLNVFFSVFISIQKINSLSAILSYSLKLHILHV